MRLGNEITNTSTLNRTTACQSTSSASVYSNNWPNSISDPPGSPYTYRKRYPTSPKDQTSQINRIDGVALNTLRIQRRLLNIDERVRRQLAIVWEALMNLLISEGAPPRRGAGCGTVKFIVRKRVSFVFTKKLRSTPLTGCQIIIEALIISANEVRNVRRWYIRPSIAPIRRSRLKPGRIPKWPYRNYKLSSLSLTKEILITPASKSE